MEEYELGAVVGLLFGASIAAASAMFGAPAWIGPLLILVAAARCYYEWEVKRFR